MNRPRNPETGPAKAFLKSTGGRVLLAVVVLALGVAAFNVVGSRWHRLIGRRTADKTPPKPVAHQANAGGSGDDSDLLRTTEERYETELAAKDQEIVRLKALVEAKGPPKNGDGELPPVTGFSSESGSDVRNLRSGIPFKSEVKVGKGTLASKERVMADSYMAEYTLSVRVPEPSKTMDDLGGVNPALSKLLPGLPALVEKAEVSRWYYLLYDNKTDRVKKDAVQIAELLSKHNYYDSSSAI